MKEFKSYQKQLNTGSIYIYIYNGLVFTVRLRTNLDRTWMEQVQSIVLIHFI